MTARPRLVAWDEPGCSVLQRAAAWHNWAPAWLPSRAALAIRRTALGRYREPVLCQLPSGLQFVAHPADLLQCLVGTTGGWEQELMNAVQPLVHSGEAVLDVGAHVGYATMLFADWVGAHGRVYAFEPVPRHREQLAGNLEVNGLRDRVVVVPSAVSDRSGVQEFFDSHRSNTGMSSLIGRRGVAASRRVSTVAIDEWLAATDAPELALAKVDVEGAEALVLRGMLRTLAAGRVRAVLIELHPDVAPGGRDEIRDAFARLPVPFTLLDWHSSEGFKHREDPGPIDYMLAVRTDAASAVRA